MSIFVIFFFIFRYLVGFCVLFPLFFYIPKWFEIKAIEDVPPSCYGMREAYPKLNKYIENENTTADVKAQIATVQRTMRGMVILFFV